MELGIHACGYMKAFDEDVTYGFLTAKQAGFASVEIPLLDMLSRRRAQTVRQAAEAYRLKITCCTALPEGCNISADDSAQRKNGEDYLRRCVDFCEAVGSPMLSGVLYSEWGWLDSAMTREEKWENSVPVIRRVSEYAESKNIFMNLEVLNRFETNLLNTLEDGCNYLELVNRPNVRLLADTFHMNIEENNIPEALKVHLSCIGSVHISENHRGLPGSGTLDWGDILNVLYANGYSGPVIFETCVLAGTQVGDSFSLRKSRCTQDNFVGELKKSAEYVKAIWNSGFIL